MDQLVPNYIPRVFNKIAIVGEAPGRDEEANGRPFVGTSGRFLAGLCNSVGIIFQNCYFGNVSQYRPPENDIARFAWDGEEINSGLQQLRDDLSALQPNVVLLLGNAALKAAKDPYTVHPLGPGKFRFSVSDWRGSLFETTSLQPASTPAGGNCLPFKCTSSYHPAACLRQYSWTPLLRFDLRRVAQESTTRTLTLPERFLNVHLTFVETIDNLRRIKRDRPVISIDIEGGIDSMTCISIATSAQHAFIIPFVGQNIHYWSEDEELLVWRELASVLSDPLIPKVLQNSLYDSFVLLYSYKLLVRGICDDTMLKHWETYCELPKGLGFQASIYTKEPFYKHERKEEGFHTHWTYCCRDSAVTYEINDVLGKHLKDPQSLEHYRLNMDLLEPLLYMEYRGMLYDTEKAVLRQREVELQGYELNYELDVLCGASFDFSCTAQEALAKVVAVTCKKREAANVRTPDHLQFAVKKEYLEYVPRLICILTHWDDLTPAYRGELNAILDVGMNIKSPRFKSYIYDTLKLPKQFHEVTGALSANYEAMLTLWKKTEHRACRLAIDISSLRTRAQMLSIHADADGRIRCGYNAVGTETGRLTCYTSPTGSGYNLQTIPNDDRDLFLPDPGYYMFQCDLAGADAWTVAAWLAFLGEPAMLEDLRAGLKPAKNLALLRRYGREINLKTREELKVLGNEVKKEDWDYFACKQGTHGSHYLMGPIKLALRIFLESEGKIHLPSAEVRNLQELYMLRYRVTKWHDYTQRQLRVKPALRSASGHLRHFFGRADEILSEALAHEPQNNTTYATNLAARRLWRDPENRDGRGGLIIQPFHQVHDALVGQFPIARTDWAIVKIREYFNNPIRIAGIPIVIPFEGGYGDNWRDTTSKKQRGVI